MNYETIKRGVGFYRRIESLEELIRRTETCIQDACDFFSSKDKMLSRPIDSANYLFGAINSLSEERFQQIGEIILQHLDEELTEAKAKIKQEKEELRKIRPSS